MRCCCAERGSRTTASRFDRLIRTVRPWRQPLNYQSQWCGRRAKRSAGMRSGFVSRKGTNWLPVIPTKKPNRGGLRLCLRKHVRKPGSERMMRQRLQTREARGSEDGCGGRRRRISWRSFSSSSGGHRREPETSIVVVEGLGYGVSRHCGTCCTWNGFSPVVNLSRIHHLSIFSSYRSNLSSFLSNRRWLPGTERVRSAAAPLLLPFVRAWLRSGVLTQGTCES